MIFHSLSEGHVHHVPQVGQRFGSEAAFSRLVAAFGALIKERLQIVRPQGIHV